VTPRPRLERYVPDGQREQPPEVTALSRSSFLAGIALARWMRGGREADLDQLALAERALRALEAGLG
jgi:hypothetical protein